MKVRGRPRPQPLRYPHLVPPLPRPLVPLLLLSLSAAMFGGCAASTPIPGDRFYRLAPPPLATPAGTPMPATILVNDLAAPALLDGRQILFRTREDALVTQRYDELLWEESPANAMAQALAEALRAARVFRFVVVPADRARAEYLLSGRLTRFEHLQSAQSPRVAAAMHLALVRADDRRTLASRTYAGEEPLTASTPEAMVEAFARLSARLIAEVVRDLQAARERLGTPPEAPRTEGHPSVKSKSIASPGGAT